jgi:hypothetical protein
MSKFTLHAIPMCSLEWNMTAASSEAISHIKSLTNFKTDISYTPKTNLSLKTACHPTALTCFAFLLPTSRTDAVAQKPSPPQTPKQ